MRTGAPDTGIPLLQDSLKALSASRYGLVTTMLKCELAGGLARRGNIAQALEMIDERIQSLDESGEFYYMPDLLRTKGEIQALAGAELQAEAERTLLQSLDWSRRQDALSFELEAQISLARFRARAGNVLGTNQDLAETFARFTEGFGTPDLLAAASLLRDFDGTSI